MSATRTNHYTTSLGRLCTHLLMLMALSFGALCSAHATNPLNLVDATDVYPVGMHLSYFEDVDGRITLQDILSGESGHTFIQSEKEVPSFSFTASAYWFQLDITNQSSPIAHWLLESQYPPLDRINVYLVDAHNNVVTYRGGDKFPFSQRAIKHRNVIFKVPLAQGESLRIYIKVKTEGSLQLPLVLRSPEAMMAKDHEEQYALGIFYGVLLAMFLYNLMIFAAIRDINYLYYVIYIGGWMLLQMSLNGLGYEYLWPESPKWANMATPFFIGFANLTVVQFARGFLLTPLHLPRIDRILKIGAAFCVLIMLSSIFASYSIAIKLGTIASLVLAILVVAAGILSLKMGIRQARYFMLAWSAFLGGIVVYALKTFGVLPNSTFTEYAMQIGAGIEVVLLSFALAHRMRLLKEDNERIQREATETLERRVQERTLELDEALIGLSDANSKLMELNHVDGLTGINNRGYFNEQFEVEWQRAARIGSPMGLLMLDIDHFKLFNDTHGHLGGDACLKLVALTIQQAIRRPADKCYRYGGEEFVALLPHTDLAGSVFIAERICKAVAALDFTYEGKHIPVTISVGVHSMAPKPTVSCETLIHCADQALYQAKHQGRNRVCSYSHPEPNTSP